MRDSTQELLFRGIGVGERRAYGPLVFFNRQRDRESYGNGQGSEVETSRLFSAVMTVKRHLSDLVCVTKERVGTAEAEIFEIHKLLLEDADLSDLMQKEINEGACAECAVEQSFSAYAESLRALGDPYLSERAKDLEDICTQLLDALSGGSADSSLAKKNEPFLLVAEDLLPSETVTLDRSQILGFVMMGGSATSHTAILARAMGIPALMGIGNIDRSFDGADALLDAGAGTLRLHPNKEAIKNALEEQKAADALIEEQKAKILRLAGRPAKTKSGKEMLVYANIGDVYEAEGATENGADGIGLLRSELLYLSKDRYPTEKELAECYAEIVAKMEGKRVVIRTLDIGADKQASYFSLPQEENPALGFRGIRVCLSRREMFKTQLRAILRASFGARLAMMLPMIVSIEEVQASKALLAECMKELDAENIPYDPKLEIGVMIETPAAAIISRALAREVDFFSVGTNDLTQYTLAADRQNPLVAQLCDQNREPVLRLIEYAAEAIHQCGGWIGICGELAADTALTQRFVDMGIDELSVSVPHLLPIRQRILECN